jgi:hypothetical protein
MLGAAGERSSGKTSPAAKRFVDHFTYYYDEFGEEFPVFRDLYELSKLIVLAHWVRKSKLPIDLELMFVRNVNSGTTTPRETPTLRVTESRDLGDAVQQVMVLGGVNLKPRPFYAQDKQGQAQGLATKIRRRRQELDQKTTVAVENESGQPSDLLVNVAPRAPPQQADPTRTAPRPTLHVMESSGQMRPMSKRGTTVRASFGESFIERPSTLGRYDLPTFKDAATGKEILNLPMVRIGFNPREEVKSKIALQDETGAVIQQHEVPIPDYLYVTSALQDIRIGFIRRPRVDGPGESPYFPSTKKGVKGYYPETNTLKLEDGTEFRFDAETGFLAAVAGADKPELEFRHRLIEDGPLVRESPADPNLRPRPPPEEAEEARPLQVVRESRGAMAASLAPSRQISSDPAKSPPTGTLVRNTDFESQIEVRRQADKLIFEETWDD